MNILHLRYAIEVEKARSFTKAADKLHMNQPHLSKAIKELEEKMGFEIFNRTRKGVLPTKIGVEFLASAKNVVAEIDQMSYAFKPENRNKITFSVAVPRASYLSRAFCAAVKGIPTDGGIDIHYQETNTMDILNGVVENEFSLGILRFPVANKNYYLNLAKNHGLKTDVIWNFAYKVLISKHHPLANKEKLALKDLKDSIEIIHGDRENTEYLFTHTNDGEHFHAQKNISVYERGSQMELLSTLTDSYMFTSVIPNEALTRFSLVEIPYEAETNQYMDMLNCKEGYQLNEMDIRFIHQIRSTIDVLVKE